MRTCLKNKQHENMIESMLYRNLNDDIENDGGIQKIEKNGMKYMGHRTKKIFMKETKMIQILGKFAIPVYKNTKVHFKDVCKQIITNLFEAKRMEVDFNPKIEKRLKSKWNKRYKSLKKQRDASLQSADLFIAGKLILRWVKRARQRLQNQKEVPRKSKIGSIFPDIHKNKFSALPRRSGRGSAFRKMEESPLSEYDNMLQFKSVDEKPSVSHDISQSKKLQDEKSHKEDNKSSFTPLKSFFNNDNIEFKNSDKRIYLKNSKVVPKAGTALNNSAKFRHRLSQGSKVKQSASPNLQAQWLGLVDSSCESKVSSKHNIDNKEQQPPVQRKNNNFVL